MRYVQEFKLEGLSKALEYSDWKSLFRAPDDSNSTQYWNRWTYDLVKDLISLKICNDLYSIDLNLLPGKPVFIQIDKNAVAPQSMLSLSESINWDKYSNPAHFSTGYDILALCFRCPYTDQITICSSSLLDYADPHGFDDSSGEIGRIMLPEKTTLKEINAIISPLLKLGDKVLPEVSRFLAGEYYSTLTVTRLQRLGGCLLLPGCSVSTCTQSVDPVTGLLVGTVSPIVDNRIIIAKGENRFIVRSSAHLNVEIYFDSYCIGLKEYIIYGE